METTIRALQDQVNAALLGSDWEALDRLIAPNARIIGPRGFIIGRDEWIGVHQGSDYQQVKLEVSDTEVHAYDRTDHADPPTRRVAAATADPGRCRSPAGPRAGTASRRHHHPRRLGRGPLGTHGVKL